MGITVIKKDGGSGGGSGGGGATNLVDWSKSYQSTTSSTYYEFASLTLTAGKKYVVKWDVGFSTDGNASTFVNLLFRTGSTVTNQVFGGYSSSVADEFIDITAGNTSVDVINGDINIPNSEGYSQGWMYMDLSAEGSDIDFTMEGRVVTGRLTVRRYNITAIEVS